MTDLLQSVNWVPSFHLGMGHDDIVCVLLLFFTNRVKVASARPSVYLLALRWNMSFGVHVSISVIQHYTSLELADYLCVTKELYVVYTYVEVRKG